MLIQTISPLKVARQDTMPYWHNSNKPKMKHWYTVGIYAIQNSFPWYMPKGAIQKNSNQTKIRRICNGREDLRAPMGLVSTNLCCFIFGMTDSYLTIALQLSLRTERGAAERVCYRFNGTFSAVSSSLKAFFFLVQ